MLSPTSLNPAYPTWLSSAQGYVLQEAFLFAELSLPSVPGTPGLTLNCSLIVSCVYLRRLSYKTDYP